MFDIVIVGLCVIAFVLGFRKGLIGELAGLVALALGVYGAARFSPATERIIAPYLAGYPTRLVAFGLTLLVIVVAVYVLSSILTRMAKAASLSVPNRVFGGVFSVAKVLLIASCLIGLGNRLWLGEGGLVTEEQKDGMVTYRFVESFAGFAFPYLDQGYDAMKGVCDKAASAHE